jgi:opacity protein-like surface antigen
LFRRRQRPIRAGAIKAPANQGAGRSGARIVPFVGAGAGMAFISDGVASCGMCSTQFAYQGTVGVGYNVNDNIRIDIDTRY